MTLDFYLTSLIVVLIPGTGVLYTISYGLFKGPGASTIAAFGCTLGIIPHIIISLLGITAVLQGTPIYFQTFKLLGVLYLFYLAWGIWHSGGILDIGQPDSKIKFKRVCINGFLINILNPKLSIFFLAFLPQFVTKEVESHLNQMIMMSIVFMALTFGVFVIYGVAASKVNLYISNSPTVIKWIQRFFAVAFASFGLKLMLLI